MAGLRPLVVLSLAVLLVLAAPVAARADDGDDVRVERPCTARSTVRLRVRARDDDELRVELTVRTTRRGAVWSVTVVHERRIAWSGTQRTDSSSGAVAVPIVCVTAGSRSRRSASRSSCHSTSRLCCSRGLSLIRITPPPV